MNFFVLIVAFASISSFSQPHYPAPRVDLVSGSSVYISPGQLRTLVTCERSHQPVPIPGETYRDCTCIRTNETATTDFKLNLIVYNKVTGQPIGEPQMLRLFKYYEYSACTEAVLTHPLCKN